MHDVVDADSLVLEALVSLLGGGVGADVYKVSGGGAEAGAEAVEFRTDVPMSTAPSVIMAQSAS